MDTPAAIYATDTDLMPDDHEVQLAIAAATMEVQPYLPVLAQALALVRSGAVVPREHGYAVQGSQEQPYVVSDTCPCPQGATYGKTKWCKHLVATELYKRWQGFLSPLALAKDAHMAQTDVHAAAQTDAPADPQADALDETAATPLPTHEDPADTVPSVCSWPPTLRSIAAIVADLSRPVPDACVASRQQGGQAIRYLHWWTVAELLDAYAPGWMGEVVRHEEMQATTITYRLSIPCVEGLVSREATGREEGEDLKYGDRSSNAESMAFRRAAAKFGVGRWLYATRDETATALTKHLRQEKEAALRALGQRCDQQGQDRAAVIHTLLTRHHVTHNKDIPLWAIEQALS